MPAPGAEHPTVGLLVFSHPSSEMGQSFGLCKERQLPGTGAGKRGRMGPGCVETSVSSLGEGAYSTIAPGAL